MTLEGYAMLLIFPIMTLLTLIGVWAGTVLIRFVRGMFD